MVQAAGLVAGHLPATCQQVQRAPLDTCQVSCACWNSSLGKCDVPRTLVLQATQLHYLFRPFKGGQTQRHSDSDSLCSHIM